MIHEVKMPPENKYYLGQITRVQFKILRSVVSLSPNFNKDDLINALSVTLQDRADSVTNWIWNHESIKKELQKFVTGSNQERQELIDHMWQDVCRLFWGQYNESLNCRLDNAQNYQDGAKQFFIEFYNELSNGISVDILGNNPCNYRKYGREQFFQAYERANPNQLICAFCDEHRPVTILRDSYLSDIEHYFPKKIYPHLACHPYNLIPICRACNSAHRDKDPLSGSARRTLGQIFLPYRDDSIRLQGAIKLEWNSSPNPKLTFTELSANCASSFSAKLQAFSEIYDIPARWQQRIHTIGEQLWRQINAFIRSEIDRNDALDLLKIRSSLGHLLNYLIEDLGNTPWDFVLVWYLSHLLVTELESGIRDNKKIEEIPLALTLKDLIERPTQKPSLVLNSETVLDITRKIYDIENNPNHPSG